MSRPPFSVVSDLLHSAFQDKQLDPRLTTAMLPTVAQALQPVIERYVTKKQSLPTISQLGTMVTNFLEDGPRVQALLATQQADEQGLWLALRQQLLLRAQRKWPQLAPTDQAEIVDDAWQRVQRYLPDFLFLARFTTWVETILQTRGIEWLTKEQERIQREISLDQPLMHGVHHEAITLGNTLTSREGSPEEQWEQHELVQAVRQQLRALCDDESLSVVQLLSEGYKQVEVAAQLNLSNAKVTRLKQAAHERIANDAQMRRLAARLGIGTA